MTILKVYLVLFIGFRLAYGEIQNKLWWKNTVFYQIFPRSYLDTDGDGNGDLNGIREKLPYLKDLGIGAIWLSPVYPSPWADSGYDVSDYKDIDKKYGTLQDFEELIKTAKKLDIKIVMDFVPNHSSDEHEWFKKSENSIEKFKNYYVWREGRNDNKSPPNNWISNYFGSAWEFNEKRGLWYFHNFDKKQPDLNYNNHAIHKEMKRTMKFWLEKGIGGFRIDEINLLYEADDFSDEPVLPGATDMNYYFSLNHTKTKGDKRDYKMLKKWRKLMDKWADKRNDTQKVLMPEALYENVQSLAKYFDYGGDIPKYFEMIQTLNNTSTAQDFKRIIDQWVLNVPEGHVPNWMMGDHDMYRLATRYPGRSDQMKMLQMLLPGCAITYYGEEIDMEDNLNITLEEGQDAPTKRGGEDLFKKYSRDFHRTPFQWDDSINAGFSKGKPWLPISKNYKNVNLANQMKDLKSHYNIYKQLIKLKNQDTLANGSLMTKVLNNGQILAIVRETDKERVILLINFSNDDEQSVNLTSYSLGSGEATVYLANKASNVEWNSSISMSKITLPEAASIILTIKK